MSVMVDQRGGLGLFERTPFELGGEVTFARDCLFHGIGNCLIKVTPAE